MWTTTEQQQQQQQQQECKEQFKAQIRRATWINYCVCVCCCWLTGIVSLCYTHSASRSAAINHDYITAARHLRYARTWRLVTIAFGTVILLLVIVLACLAFYILIHISEVGDDPE